jgi:hypothetical protein
LKTSRTFGRPDTIANLLDHSITMPAPSMPRRIYPPERTTIQHTAGSPRLLNAPSRRMSHLGYRLHPI